MGITHNSANTDAGTMTAFKENEIVLANDIRSNDIRDSIISMSDNSMISFMSSTSNENEINKRRLAFFEKEFSVKLISLILGEHFEYGFDNQSDILIRSLMNTNSSVAKEWLNNIYNQSYGNSEIIIGILRLIARFDIEDVSPQGQTMAIAALSHRDTEVQECGIRAFESWASFASLEILKSTNINKGWLKEYLDSVIKDIEIKYGIAS